MLIIKSWVYYCIPLRPIQTLLERIRKGFGAPCYLVTIAINRCGGSGYEILINGKYHKLIKNCLRLNVKYTYYFASYMPFLLSSPINFDRYLPLTIPS